MPCCRIRYTISLQAELAPGDQVIQVVLAGSIDNSTGERPVIAYLFGVEATSLINQTSLGVVGALITVQLCRAADCSEEAQLVLVTGRRGRFWLVCRAASAGVQLSRPCGALHLMLDARPDAQSPSQCLGLQQPLPFPDLC